MISSKTSSLFVGATVSNFKEGSTEQMMKQNLFRLNPIRLVSSKALTEPVQKELFEAEILSGTPREALKRKVRIYKPVESTMQSGQSGKSWKIDWDIIDRWANPVMGWSSSADAMQALNVRFETRDQAVLFAERQGYDWKVQEPKEEKWTKKTYADNYTFVPGHLRLHKTK